MKYLVKDNDYNGHKDVLFMMNMNDFRLTDDRFKDDYEVLGKGKYAKKVLTVNGIAYKVFSDWSVKAAF